MFSQKLEAKRFIAQTLIGEVCLPGPVMNSSAPSSTASRLLLHAAAWPAGMASCLGPKLRGLGRLAVLSPALLLALGSGCRTESSSGGDTLTSEEAAPAGRRADAAPPAADRPQRPLLTDKSVATALPVRDSWFADGPGRQAIEARSRGNGAQAKKLLRSLLDSDESTPKEKAGAQLLLALIALEAGNHRAAASGLAKARVAESLEPLRLELIALEADALLELSRPAAAVELLEAVASESADLQLLYAEALRRAKNSQAAEEQYRSLLSRKDAEAHHGEARLELADILRGRQHPDAQQEALALAALVLEGGDVAKRLRSRAQSILEALGSPGNVQPTAAPKTRTQSNIDKNLAGYQANYRKRKYKTAERGVDRLIKKYRKKMSADQLCRAYYLKGSAIFKQRQRGRATESFQAAVSSCKKSKNTDLEVKCRYQGARGLYAQGRHDDAGHAFERLAKEHGGHSYADDSLINAGEAWESHGDEARAVINYLRVLSAIPNGDMRDEARRRIMLVHFKNAEYGPAEKTISQWLASKEVHGEERAKLLYFRGKARQREGHNDGAISDYIQVLRERPLSYGAVHAWSRLKELDAELWRRQLKEQLLRARALELPSVKLPNTPEGRRAEIWSQLGVSRKTRRALDDGGIDGWPRVAALARTGSWFESQRSMARMRSDWRQAPPLGERRILWELAHPLPFLDLVAPREKKTSLPALLSFAIMQTESRFDPSQTSWAGARGLMQLMPGTAETVARRLSISKPSRSQLHRPELNLTLGIHNLSNLVTRFGATEGSVALAIPSYNAGPGNVDKWLVRRGQWDLDLFIEAIPFDETRHYTQSVLRRWMTYRWLYGSSDPEQRLPYLPTTLARKPI